MSYRVLEQRHEVTLVLRQQCFQFGTKPLRLVVDGVGHYLM